MRLSNSGLITSGSLSRFLRTIRSDNLGFIDRLKLSYRPYICPYVELLEHIKPGDRICDVGCGMGQFCLLASHFKQPAHLCGFEISSELIEAARTYFNRANIQIPHNFSVYDGIHFPSSLSEADKVFLIDVIHHVPPRAQHSFISALVRGMKPGACLIVKDIEADSPLVVFNRLHDMIMSGARGHELNSKDLVSMVQGSGLMLEENKHKRMWVYPHYTALVKKITPLEFK